MDQTLWGLVSQNRLARRARGPPPDRWPPIDARVAAAHRALRPAHRAYMRVFRRLSATAPAAAAEGDAAARAALAALAVAHTRLRAIRQRVRRETQRAGRAGSRRWRERAAAQYLLPSGCRRLWRHVRTQATPGPTVARRIRVLSGERRLTRTDAESARVMREHCARQAADDEGTHSEVTAANLEFWERRVASWRRRVRRQCGGQHAPPDRTTWARTELPVRTTFTEDDLREVLAHTAYGKAGGVDRLRVDALSATAQRYDAVLRREWRRDRARQRRQRGGAGPPGADAAPPPGSDMTRAIAGLLNDCLTRGGIPNTHHMNTLAVRDAVR